MSDNEEDWANDGVVETRSATRRSAQKSRSAQRSSPHRDGQRRHQHEEQRQQQHEENVSDDEEEDDEEEDFDGQNENDGADANDDFATPSSQKHQQRHVTKKSRKQNNTSASSPPAAATTTRAAQLRYAARHKVKKRIESAEEVEQRAAEKLAKQRVGADFLPLCATVGTESMPLVSKNSKLKFARSNSASSGDAAAAGSSGDKQQQQQQQKHLHLDPKKREALEREQRQQELQKALHRAAIGILPLDKDGLDIGSRLYKMGNPHHNNAAAVAAGMETEGQRQLRMKHKVLTTAERLQEQEQAECTFRPQISQVAELLFPASRDPELVINALSKHDMDRRRKHMQHLRSASDAAFARQHTFAPETAPVSQLLCQRSETIHNLHPAGGRRSGSAAGGSRTAAAVAKAAADRLFRDAADKDVRDALRRQFVDMWRQRGWEDPVSGKSAAAAGVALAASEIAEMTERLSRRYKDKEQVLQIIRDEMYKQQQQQQIADDEEDWQQQQQLLRCSALEVSVSMGIPPLSSRSNSSRPQSARHQQQRSDEPLRLIDALCPVAGSAAATRENNDELQKLGKKLMTLQLSSRMRPL